MKKVIALTAVLVMGALGIACGDAPANNGSTNANRAPMNANTTISTTTNTTVNGNTGATNTTTTTTTGTPGSKMTAGTPAATASPKK